MTTNWQRWVEAATILGRTPTELVPCPACGMADLRVTDVVPWPDAEVFERHLECPACGARNVLRKSATPAASEKDEVARIGACPRTTDVNK